MAALAFGIVAMRRNQKTDDASVGREWGAIISDIGYIKSTIDNTNKKLDGYNERLLILYEKLAAVEEGHRSLDKRIDLQNSEIDSVRKRYHDLANIVHTVNSQMEFIHSTTPRLKPGETSGKA